MTSPDDVLRITIAGAPVPYSTRAGVATRKLPDGSRAPIVKNGRPVVWNYRPDHVKQYQDHLRRAAEDAMAGRPLFEGPICLTVRAYMPIPRSGMRKAQRELAEREMHPHDKRPDLDNLHKAIKDAFKKRVWHDDSQVAMYGQPFKAYSPRPRLEIEVRRISTLADVAIAERGEPAPGGVVRFVQPALL